MPIKFFLRFKKKIVKIENRKFYDPASCERKWARISEVKKEWENWSWPEEFKNKQYETNHR